MRFIFPRLLASMEPHSYECGNSHRRCHIQYTQALLQWSRTLTSAEISRPSHLLKSDWPASMEPHSYECGNRPFLADPFPFGQCFNGAALLRVRKSHDQVNYAAHMRASMEPHSYECGNGQRVHPQPPGHPCFNGAALLRVRK